MIRAAIFDLGGTLIETEEFKGPLYARARDTSLPDRCRVVYDSRDLPAVVRCGISDYGGKPGERSPAEQA